MQGLKDLLLKEEARLSSIIQETKEQLLSAPEGKLKVSKDKERIQYYQVIPGVTLPTGRYIKQENLDLAKQLAQKVYNLKILKLAESRFKQIQKLASEYEDEEMERIFLNESQERKQLISPIEPTWEQFLAEWKADSYEGKGFTEKDPLILTDKGERVRSKSEKEIANYFNAHNIPYKYEKPLYLKGPGVVYPDFTILSPKTRKEIYWEHEGRMDDPVYAQYAVKKLNTYARNGIFPGKNLILSFETSNWSFNKYEIEMLVKEYL